MKTAIPVLFVATLPLFSAVLAGAAEPTGAPIGGSAGATEAASAPREASTPGTPTEVWHTYVEANKAQNLVAFKRTLAKADLEKVEQSTDADIVERMGREGSLSTETRNEEISDNIASLEVKFSDGWQPVWFRKEDGNWKVAFRAIGTPIAAGIPWDTWEDYLEALRRRSVDMFESCIAQRTVEKFKQRPAFANEGFWKVVELLERKLPTEPFPTRAAKISADGETATLEVQDTTRGNVWVRLHFVKEDDGVWKLMFPDDQIGELVPGELVL